MWRYVCLAGNSLAMMCGIYFTCSAFLILSKENMALAWCNSIILIIVVIETYIGSILKFFNSKKET